jgi:DNA-binding MarR family transcriptional regulator
MAEDKQEKALQVYMLFIETAHLVLKNADSHMHKAVGLSAGQFAALMVIQSSGVDITSANLAEGTGTKPHNITLLIERMKRDGLVKTEKRITDRRFVHITLTEKGRALIARAMGPAKDTVAQTMTSLDDAELALLEKLLNRLKQNVRGG